MIFVDLLRGYCRQYAQQDSNLRPSVGRILNHVEPGVTKIYDRYSYDKEKREALEAWSKRLVLIVSDLKEVKAGA